MLIFDHFENGSVLDGVCSAPVIASPRQRGARRAVHMDEDLSFPGQEVDYDDSHAPDNPLAKKKPKSGGFQSMGLSPAVYKSVMRKGYKVPPRHRATYRRAPRPRPALPPLTTPSRGFTSFDG